VAVGESGRLSVHPLCATGWDRFTGRHREYTNADTWFRPGHLTGIFILRGRMGTLWMAHKAISHLTRRSLGIRAISLDYRGRKAATAQARIEGDDPLALRIVNLKPRVEAIAPTYGGRYPCGSLTHRGILVLRSVLSDQRRQVRRCGLDGDGTAGRISHLARLWEVLGGERPTRRCDRSLAKIRSWRR